MSSSLDERDIQDGARDPKDRFGAGIHFEEDSFHPMYCVHYITPKYTSIYKYKHIFAHST